MDLKKLPKIELHVHLDCSISYEFVHTLDESINAEVYKRNFIAPHKCKDLNHYLSFIDNQINMLQTERALRLSVRDLMKQLKEDNVIYAEIRFSPFLHLKEGLSLDDVLCTITDELLKCIDHYQVEANLILCTLREFSEEKSIAIVELAKKYSASRVVGFDIASDEKNHNLDKHIAAFSLAEDYNICKTAHAGEAKGSQSVWETLNDINPRRIGHGVRSIEDKELLAFLKNNNIHLEICPTSNICTNIYRDYGEHPINELFNYNISVGINTDGRTSLNTNLSKEYAILHRYFSWGKSHFLKCNLNAVEAAFITSKQKKKLKEKISKAYEVFS